MKRKKWDRNDYKCAGCIAVIAVIVFVKLFVFVPVFDILNGTAAFILTLLMMLLPVVFFIGWALKNESRQGAILQIIGFALIFSIFAFLWFAMWHPEATWEFPIPLLLIFGIVIAAIILCFTFSTPPGRR
ncbi:MAG: hypothetical protein LUE11_00890 [Clostridia bacterium]|nr:hypothetical protein [Clostridia bacterium]